MIATTIVSPLKHQATHGSNLMASVVHSCRPVDRDGDGDGCGDGAGDGGGDGDGDGDGDGAEDGNGDGDGDEDGDRHVRTVISEPAQ